MPDQKVLVVEDEENIVEALRYNLEREGYAILTAMDGENGMELARGSNPDLIILDVMLPRLDGFEVCRILRRDVNTPILMLTAKGEEVDRIVRLELAEAFNSMATSLRTTIHDLASERDKLSAVLDTMVDGVVVIGSEDQVDLLNAAGEALLGVGGSVTEGGRFMEVLRDYELQRLGDYAEGIAKISLMMGDEPPLKPLIDIPRMSEKATDMLRRSLDALGCVHTKRSASKMSANEMNPRKITSSFSKREKMRRNPFNRRNSLSISLRLLYISRSYSHG